MTVFSTESFADHEQVVFISDDKVGLRAIIAIHSTRLGPALGGCRMYPYADEASALRDVLRLSRGMTFKAAAAGLGLGGGKSVILGDPRKNKTPELLRAMGVAVNRLGGRYITAEDVGTTVDDFAWVRQSTRHVVGLPEALGGTGDPSPTTALGVYHGIVASVEHRLGRDLCGLTVAVQGLGNVGWNLCRLLADAGAHLVVTDIDATLAHKASAEFDARVVEPEAIYAVQADVFAPCAMGAVVNDRTLPQMKFRVIAGGSNNQLARDEHGRHLRDREILYAPDFVINAGGLIRVASEHEGFNAAKVDAQVQGIGATLHRIFELASRSGTPTQSAAMQLVQERLGGHAAGGIQSSSGSNNNLAERVA
ncbi:amino acid dehydrogenase [Variovorax sp. SG517]|uniref:Leu/Phe/Val dehydrogenase n=1 Tax=unclassified Variovorax TaxID=663243 RepID=UPI00159D236F|nr:amino acid dehydrogenase [Variovorax sp. SG517]NVM90700.1 leucine dehydrogenase [Variovorax sp. SG517]